MRTLHILSTAASICLALYLDPRFYPRWLNLVRLTASADDLHCEVIAP
jgi:hypothetical protein